MATSTKTSVRIGDAAVKAKTGKTWPEWFKILDKAGGRKMDHQAIVAFLVESYQLPPWWRQMVTVTYEQERGLREKYQTPRGYQVSASKTIAVPIAVLYSAWHDKKQRVRWLPDAPLTMRKATAEKSLRIAWDTDKTTVEVGFVTKGPAKSQVTVQHNKLTDAAAVERLRTYWSSALARLKTTLEKQPL